MKKLSLLFLLPLTLINAQTNEQFNDRVISSVDSTNSKEIVLKHEFKVKVSVDSVWNTFTTKRGWENAFVAQAEVDFKINGTIKTSYDKNATIGDSTTIILHVKNYIPKKLISLQAEISDHFPEFMISDAKDFYNIIIFESLDKNLTRVTSYGLGYKNNKKYLSLMAFFIEGNELSYNNLISYLETGIPVKY